MNSYLFDDIKIGQIERFTVIITKDMEDKFRFITDDMNPLHMDDEFALEVGNGKFEKHVVFGMLTASFFSTLAGVYLPGKYSLIHSINTKFMKPVYVGDELIIEGKINEKHDALRLVQIHACITNQSGMCVAKADMKVLVLK